jgi:hypothetical protein
MKSLFSFCFITSFLATTALAAEPPECKQQKIEGTVIEMCLLRGAAFQHDLYTMKADKTLIFALVDDFSEKVELTHEVPPGPGIEFALSKQGESSSRITGGCVPQSKDGMEVARLCNFTWGKVQVVKDIRFEFK